MADAAMGSDDLRERPPQLSAEERLRRRGGFSPIDRLGYDRPTSEDIAKAIAIVEDSRNTHVEWVESLTLAPLRPEDGKVGDIDDHRRCIADYDHVLTVLRRLAPYEEETSDADVR